MDQDAAVVDSAPPRQDGEPHLGVFIGAERYGLPLGRLREVARLTGLRRIAGAAPHVAGMVNLRGEIICVLDARAILGLPPAPSYGPGPAYVIALRDFDFPVALVVDWVTDIFNVDKSAIETAPEDWTPERRACVLGAATVGVEAVGLLDLDRVVRR